MKQVVKFEADDGTVYDTEAEAVAHDNRLSLSVWYEDNKLYGQWEGSQISWHDFLDWCTTHKDKLKFLVDNL